MMYRKFLILRTFLADDCGFRPVVLIAMRLLVVAGGTSWGEGEGAMAGAVFPPERADVGSRSVFPTGCAPSMAAQRKRSYSICDPHQQLELIPDVKALQESPEVFPWTRFTWKATFSSRPA